MFNSDVCLGGLLGVAGRGVLELGDDAGRLRSDTEPLTVNYEASCDWLGQRIPCQVLDGRPVGEQGERTSEMVSLSGGGPGCVGRAVFRRASSTVDETARSRFT